MSKPANAKRAKGAPAPKPYEEAGDAALTLRVPKPLLVLIDAKVSALNAKKQGHWSRNGYIVFALEAALDEKKAREG